MSEFKFDIVYRVFIILQAADGLPRLKTKGEDLTQLDEEAPVLTVFPDYLAWAHSTKEPFLETIEDPKGLFVSFPSENCFIVGIIDDENMKIPILPEFKTAQCTDSDCRAALAPVGKPNTYFNYYSAGVLVRCSPLHCASH